MNLAPPAPKVEPATAEKALEEDAAIAEVPQQSEAVRVGAAQVVDPALPVDDPMRYAPAMVANPKKIEKSALSVEVLRGNTGSNFESYAAVCRGAPPRNFLKKIFPFYFDERDFISYGEIRKYIFVKGNVCFVYCEHTDLSPLYAIPFDDLYAVLEDPDKPDKKSITVSPVPNTNKPRKEMKTVLLKYKSNDKLSYQFTFDTSKDPSLVKRFLDVFSEKRAVQAARASHIQAKVIGNAAKQHQPDI